MQKIVTHSFTPAMEFLLACLRNEPYEDIKKRGININGPSFDWHEFAGLIKYHRVFPQVYSYLKECKTLKIPENIYRYIKNIYERNLRHALKLSAELARLSKLFKQNNIPVISLKGPVLALQLYGSIGRRYAGDLDLLIDPANLKQADQLLRKEGYSCMSLNLSLSPKQYETLMKLTQQLRYKHFEQNIVVEIHWRFFGNPYLFPTDINNIKREVYNTNMTADELEILPRDINFLYLCTHGSIHTWARLFWICDIAEILRNEPGIISEELITSAQKHGVLRSLVQSCILSKILFALPLPGHIQECYKKDRALPGLVKTAIYNIKKSGESVLLPSFNRIKTFLCIMKLRKNIKYKIAGTYSIICTSPNDWRILRFPDRLFPLYYLLRPLFILFYVISIRHYRQGHREVDLCKDGKTG